MEGLTSFRGTEGGASPTLRTSREACPHSHRAARQQRWRSLAPERSRCELFADRCRCSLTLIAATVIGSGSGNGERSGLESPPPDYTLIKASDYAQLSLQYSRGCPFSCEFCEITVLLGHRVRVKSTQQILLELENIYHTGFRGNVFL